MSSANKKNNGSLEDAFRHRMQDAEATPAPDLWARIDHDLTVQENIQYKKRFVYYRQLAAACLVLLIMAGAVLTYQFKTAEPAQESLTIKEVESGKSKAIADKVNTPKADPALTTSPPVTSGQLGLVSKEDNNTDASEAGKISRAVYLERSVAGNSIAGRKTPSALAVNEIKKESSGLLPDNALVAGSGSEQDVAGVLKDGSEKSGSIIARQSFILSSPTILSLMAKGQQKTVDFELDPKADARKQAEVLAKELNEDVKPEQKSEKQTSDKRWSMSMAYMPTYFAQNIGLPDKMMNTINRFSVARSGPSITTETSANMEKARDEFENNTDPAFSYAVEVKTGYKLGKKLKLLAGFGFSQNTARTNTSYVIEQFWTNPQTYRKVELTPSAIFLPSLNNSFTTDSISVSQTDPFDVDYRYRMVTLPVGLLFEDEIRNGWNWYVQSGVAANIMIESSVSSSRSDVLSVSYDHQDDSPFRRTQFSGNVGLGVSKQVSDAITVALGPEFRGFFNTMLSEPERALATQGKPYTIGVNMSLNYQLGKLNK